jgi:hypothetical protein
MPSQRPRYRQRSSGCRETRVVLPRSGTRPGGRQRIELLLEPLAAALALEHRVEELLEDDLLSGAWQYESREPAAVSGRPTRAPLVANVVAQQERLQPLLGSGDVALGLLPSAHDVAERFFLGTGDVHGGESAGAQRQGEIASIEPIGLDAHAGPARNQRGSSHKTLLADRAQIALEPETAGARFIHEAQLASA